MTNVDWRYERALKKQQRERALKKLFDVLSDPDKGAEAKREAFEKSVADGHMDVVKKDADIVDASVS